MSTGAIIAVIVAIVVVIAIVAAVMMMRGDGTSAAGLRRRFGPEYERALARHDGDDRATRQELGERVKRYGGMERRQLGAQERERYGARWAEVKSHFVDEPSRALREADRLIAEVAVERGYPGADSPEHFDALSVHHPYQVQGYRQAHALAEHAGAGGRTATEDMRQALVAARELFDDMLRDAGTSPSRKEMPEPVAPAAVETTPAATAWEAAPAETSMDLGTMPFSPVATPVPASQPVAAQDGHETDPEAVEGGQEHHRPPAGRFAVTGGNRRDHGADDQS